MNDDVKALIRWDKEIEEMYQTFGYTVHQRKP